MGIFDRKWYAMSEVVSNPTGNAGDGSDQIDGGSGSDVQVVSSRTGRTLPAMLAFSAILAVGLAEPARAGMFLNGMTMNGLWYNGMTMNGYWSNGVDMGGLSLDGVILPEESK
jgi:hypothetical protein